MSIPGFVIDLLVSDDSVTLQESCNLSDFFEKRPDKNIAPAITPHIIIQPKRGRTNGSTASVIAGLNVDE